MKRLNLLFIILFNSSIYSQEFFSPQTNINLQDPDIAFWLDYDNDNDLDILVCKYSTTDLKTDLFIYENYNYTFNTKITLPRIYNHIFKIVLEDYNNDGYVDIVVNGRVNSDYKITLFFYNKQNNSFEWNYLNLNPNKYQNFDCGDYNNDGIMDIITTEITDWSTHDGLLKIWNKENNDNYSYTNIQITHAGEGTCKFGDCDNDGDLDILLSDGILINNNSAFLKLNTVIFPISDTGPTEWVDYDSDGDLDVFFSGWITNSDGITAGPKIILYKNVNNNFIEMASLIISVITQGTSEWGDYDNDGDLDLLMNGWTDSYLPSSKIYKNEGNDIFSEVSVNILNTTNGKWGDYNNDGYLDILLSGSYVPTNPLSYVYRNIIHAKKISYSIQMPNCGNTNDPIEIFSGNIYEGNKIEFPEYTLPTELSFFQNFYNMLVGAQIVFPNNVLKENIHINVNLNILCESGLSDNPTTEDILELLSLYVQVTGDSSGTHDLSDYYSLIDNAEILIKIPIKNIQSFIDITDLENNKFITYITKNESGLITEGIRGELDSLYYTIYSNNLTEINLGYKQNVTDIKNITEIPITYALYQNFPIHLILVHQ